VLEASISVEAMLRVSARSEAALGSNSRFSCHGQPSQSAMKAYFADCLDLHFGVPEPGVFREHLSRQSLLRFVNHDGEKLRSL
jgi:hypothetical protein